MEKFEIAVEKRTVLGKKVGVLRREGKLPGVIYGHKFEPVPVVMDLREATRVLNKATGSTIVTLNLEGKEIAALIREKQRNYIKNTILHVDFQSVSLTEKIRAAVNVELTGTAPAVKDFNGVVVEGLSSIEVEALPKDLPERFVIDITALKQIGDSILVKDVAVAANVTVLTPHEEMVVLVTLPASEEVAEIGEEAAAEPEVIEKGKKEEVEEK